MTEFNDDDIPASPVTVDDVVDDLIADFGTATEPFDYLYWADQMETGLAMNLPGFSPKDPMFWAAVLMEMRRRGRIQGR